MTGREGDPQPPRCSVSWCDSGHRLDAPVHVRTVLHMPVGEVLIVLELVKIRDDPPRADLMVEDESHHRQTRLSLLEVGRLWRGLGELLDLARGGRQ